MIRVGFFEEFTDYRRFEEGFVVVLESWDESAWVKFEERFWFVVWVHFDVLVGYFLFFQDL